MSFDREELRRLQLLAKCVDVHFAPEDNTERGLESVRERYGTC
jgi:hypothetical protein